MKNKIQAIAMTLAVMFAACGGGGEAPSMSGSIVVQPFGPTDGYATTKLPTGAEKGVLVIDLAGKHGNSIGLTARTMLKPGTSQESPVLITCTVEYGAPGKSSFMEVDVPVGRTNGVPAVAEDGSTVVVAPEIGRASCRARV